MSIYDKHGKFNGKELEYLSSYLDSEGDSNEKPWVLRLEESVSNFVGIKYAVACNSGTSGLHMAMYACDIGPGDEVITPGLTVVMDAYAVLHMGATPVFVDVDRSTYGISVDEIRKKITDKTKAIITVSLQGLSVDMDPILELARENKIIVIESDLEDTMPTQSEPQHDVSISGQVSCYTHPMRGQWADFEDSVSEASVADDAFDIWSMLENSAGPAPCVMGASLDPVPECDEEVADDDSLVNQSLAVRALVKCTNRGCPQVLETSRVRTAARYGRWGGGVPSRQRFPSYRCSFRVWALLIGCSYSQVG